MTWGYCIGTSPDRFTGSFVTREEALYEAINAERLGEGQVVTLGMGALHQPTLSIDAIIDDLVSNASDECGEAAEDWPDATTIAVKVLETRLQAVLDTWLDEFDQRPKFYTVTNAEAIVITKEILAAHHASLAKSPK